MKAGSKFSVCTTEYGDEVYQPEVLERGNVARGAVHSVTASVCVCVCVCVIELTALQGLRFVEVC